MADVSFKLLLVPIILFANWEILGPYLEPGIPNPFAPIFLLSGYIPTSSPEDIRYRKTWSDIAFIIYYVVFFSFVREILAIKVSRPLAKYFGLKRESKIDRFGEQTYAFLYFAFFGAWGYVCQTYNLRKCPTNNYVSARHDPVADILVQDGGILGRSELSFFPFLIGYD